LQLTSSLLTLTEQIMARGRPAMVVVAM
jgi:hypothetical protein